LDHETFDLQLSVSKYSDCGTAVAYDAMELAALVALGLPPAILGLARAELAEILSSLWDYISEQLHLDPPQLLPCSLMSVTMVGLRAFARLWVRPRETRRRWSGVRGKATIWVTWVDAYLLG
jgi:hypothetical protein